MSKQPHVWVMETLWKGKWSPCSTCDLTKRQAQETIKLYVKLRWDGKQDKYRAAKYEREKP